VGQFVFESEWGKGNEGCGLSILEPAKKFGCFFFGDKQLVGSIDGQLHQQFAGEIVFHFFHRIEIDQVLLVQPEELLVCYQVVDLL
jgi:hypothetical protein